MLKRSFMLVGMFSVSLFSYASEGSISAGESTFRTVGGMDVLRVMGFMVKGEVTLVGISEVTP